MSAGGDTSQISEKTGAIASLPRFIAIGTITGLGFGLVMAIVSNGFVLGVKALSSLREGQLFDVLRFGDLPISFAPIASLNGFLRSSYVDNEPEKAKNVTEVFFH